jgi:hypothetical protein
MAAAFAIALFVVFFTRLATPHGDRLGVALRSTARWSFVLFWLSYVGGALVTLFGTRFQPLARRGRDLGLSFASAHLVHLGLVALLISIKGGYPRGSLIFFGTGVFFIYLLALLSISRFSAALGQRNTLIVRTLGVEYIALAFLVDFAKNPFHGGINQLVAYLPFLTLAIAGPLLRIAATLKRLTGSRWLATS